MVHLREIEGTEIALGNQGALFGNAMTWWDHDTGSVWSQPTGEAILGPRTGAKLELLPSTLTTWGAFSQSHPETLALDAPGGPQRFLLDDMVVVVDLSGNTAAYPIPSLKQFGVINARVGEVPVAVVWASEQWSVFGRAFGETVVTLALKDGVLEDPESGTTWDAVRGLGIEGPLAGEPLAHIAAFTSFPSDVDTFYPNATFWTR